MLRALLKELGLEQRAGGVRVPAQRSGAPETLTAIEYGNLIRTPDQRSTAGKRDVALLRLLGDCGLRNLELCQLCAKAIRKPRANSRHHYLFVRGKGGVEREIEIPEETYATLGRWLSAHPGARRGSALADDTVLFPALAGKGAGKEPLSQQALAKVLSRYGRRAGIPARLAHPHALRAYYATTLSAQGLVIQQIKEKLGHASIETTARYLAKLGDGETAGEAINRHHQDQNRRRAA
jgi:site-specific recombinase XerD